MVRRNNANSFVTKDSNETTFVNISVALMNVRFPQTLALHSYPIQLDNEIKDNLHWCLMASP